MPCGDATDAGGQKPRIVDRAAQMRMIDIGLETPDRQTASATRKWRNPRGIF